MTLPSHGANAHYLYEALQLEQPEQTIDFSANLNPLGPPPSLTSSKHQAQHSAEPASDGGAVIRGVKTSSSWCHPRAWLASNAPVRLVFFLAVPAVRYTHAIVTAIPVVADMLACLQSHRLQELVPKVC